MRLLQALRRRPLDRPPIWFMRQAGRYLPEYRKLRERFSFDEAMRTPDVAAEITVQPLRRFPLDAAIIFSDIMTPLTGMGVTLEFDPGPKLTARTAEEVARLGEFDASRVGFVAETVAAVRAAVDTDVSVIGFAGGPVTLLAYLLEGGGSQQFPAFRRAMHTDSAPEALAVLSRAMRRYLEMQVEAGANCVQLFDTWAGLLSVDRFEALALPAARDTLKGLNVPTVYFAPGATHLLESFQGIGATAYGVDWRLPLDEAWKRVGDGHVLQGNLDPSVLLADPETVRAATTRVLEEASSRPGHIFNLGHGILPATPVESVGAMVDTVVGWPSSNGGVTSQGETR